MQAKTSAAARETGCRVIMMESPARMRREENTDSPAQTGRTHMEDRRHRADRVCPVLLPGEDPAAGSP